MIDETEGTSNENLKRRDLLTIMPLTGLIGTIAFLLNVRGVTAGIRQITGQVEVNGRLINAEQIKGPNSLLVPSDSMIKTDSTDSIVFVIGKDAFLLRNNCQLVLKPQIAN